jgi:hypothetical protein
MAGEQQHLPSDQICDDEDEFTDGQFRAPTPSKISVAFGSAAAVAASAMHRALLA